MKNWEAILVVLDESDQVALTAKQIATEVQSRRWGKLKGITPWNTVVRDMKESAGKKFFKKHEILNAVSGERSELWCLNGHAGPKEEAARIRTRYPRHFTNNSDSDLKSDEQREARRNSRITNFKLKPFSPEFDGTRSAYSPKGPISGNVEHGRVVNALAIEL
ncbi:MAG TPA: hypothetical protein VHX68_02630, partial [Planctomycetaceae bacterium]|nr:hypothetical protein [Planctomycetaceae bacterium]